MLPPPPPHHHHHYHHHHHHHHHLDGAEIEGLFMKFTKTRWFTSNPTPNMDTISIYIYIYMYIYIYSYNPVVTDFWGWLIWPIKMAQFGFLGYLYIYTWILIYLYAYVYMSFWFCLHRLVAGGVQGRCKVGRQSLFCLPRCLCEEFAMAIGFWHLLFCWCYLW